jgi:hypothetical protein
MKKNITDIQKTIAPIRQFIKPYSNATPGGDMIRPINMRIVQTEVTTKIWRLFKVLQINNIGSRYNNPASNPTGVIQSRIKMMAIKNAIE